MQQNARTIFCKPQALLFALKDAVSKELDQMEKAVILLKISHAEWVALLPWCLKVMSAYACAVVTIK